MLQLQSVDFPIELTTDLTGATGWKVLVCLTDYQIPVDVPINTSDTFCGQAVGRGVPTFNPSGNAVYEASPTSNQVTYDQMLAWEVNGTELLFRVRKVSGGSVGNAPFISGVCTVTNTTINATAGSPLGFAFTLTGQGVIDLVP